MPERGSAMITKTPKQIFKEAAAIAGAAACLFTGCVGMPEMQRQTNATTEVSEKWSRDQNERITAVFSAAQGHDGQTRVDWTVDNNERGNGDQFSLSALENSLPGGISLVYYAVGILLLFWVAKRIVNSSNAVKLTLSAADNAIAKQIKKLEGKLNSRISESERLDVVSMLRDLEHERGKLRG